MRRRLPAVIPNQVFLAGPRPLLWVGALRHAGVPTRLLRPRPSDRGRLALRCTTDVPGLGSIDVTVLLPRQHPEAIVVYASGPSDSPHRYADGSLCMWFPRDPASARWTRTDGPVLLLAHVIAHLAREEWWRRTGEWVGAEADHGQPDDAVTASDPTNVSPLTLRSAA